MPLIQITDMEFYYDEYFLTVFDKVNLNLDVNWKLGLIGRNGRGKSTLLKLIHGILDPTKGNIKVPLKTEMFPYEIEDTTGTALKVIRSLIAPFDKWEKRMKKLEVEMFNKEICENYLIEYGEILD